MHLWQQIRTTAYARHEHEEAYAAVVLSAGYEEAGDRGRFRVKAGDVLFHDALEAHLDRFSGSVTQVMNLMLPSRFRFQPGLARTADPDLIVRVAERDEVEAANLLIETAHAKPQPYIDWPDELAASLLENPSVCLSAWADLRGLNASAVSRGFAQVFGISPCGFRARARARKAWQAVMTTREPLVMLAAELGFSDQAHMTRSVKALAGHPPAALRSRK